MIRYLPLLVVISLALLGASALQAAHGFSWHGWMHGFMGLFLLEFSMLKLFDVPGFARGFARYDLLAKRSRAYALAYPFLELALALGYLSQWSPKTVYIATAVLMGFGAVGVLAALKKGLDVDCACLGTSLNVPLSTIALTEDIGMAGMAMAMLFL